MPRLKNTGMETLTYEESVRRLRAQPSMTATVNQCYLDEDNLVAARRFANSQEFAEVIRILGLNQRGSPQKILDVGCGNGIAAYAFASLGQNVCAIDPDPSRDVGLQATARLAQSVKNGSLSTCQAFAEELAFADGVFDIIYARQALHHFGDLQKALSECWRVLKPDGKLFATREHVVSDEDQLKTFLQEHPLHLMHGSENAYPLVVYLDKIKNSGFIIERVYAPFDTVVNHYPFSNEDVKELLFRALQSKAGDSIATLFSRLPLTQRLYKKRLSRLCNAPGRLYSFLCRKP